MSKRNFTTTQIPTKHTNSSYKASKRIIKAYSALPKSYTSLRNLKKVGFTHDG